MITINGVPVKEFALNCCDDIDFSQFEEEETDGAPEDSEAPEE